MQFFFTGLVTGIALTWLLYRLRYQSIRQRVLKLSDTLQENTKRSHAKLQAELDASTQQSLNTIAKEKEVLLIKECQLKEKAHIFALEVENHKKELAKIESQKKEFLRKENTLSQLITAAQQKVEEIGNLSIDEARAAILEKAESETAKLLENKASALYAVYEKEAHRKANEILFSAIERKTQSLTKDFFLTRLPFLNKLIIPSFIGKDGRNIHSLEDLLQVKLIIEEDWLLISSHDAKQRFIAQKVLEEVLKQCKVSLPRIQTTYDAIVQNVDAHICNEGIAALQTIDPTASFSHEVTKALGNLSLKSSSGQNVLKHSLEVAELMGIFAAELFLRPKTAKLMGLFHDIGKTLTIEFGESHATAGKKFLQQNQIDEEIVNAVAAHHGECVVKSEEARLLPICDRLSAQLPGIRTPTEPSFLQIVRQCEEIAKRHASVLSAWAHYAGSHIELIVRHKGQEKELSLRLQLESELNCMTLPVNITLLNVGLKHTQTKTVL